MYQKCKRSFSDKLQISHCGFMVVRLNNHQKKKKAGNEAQFKTNNTRNLNHLQEVASNSTPHTVVNWKYA
jgi:transcriptional regulatory protein LevR